jgi:two-component system sensor kinase FixL
MGEAARGEGLSTRSFDLLCVMERDGIVLRATPSFWSALGCSENDLVGRRLVDRVHPHDIEATRAALARLSQGTPAVEFRTRYRCGDGSYRAMVWNALAEPRTGLVCAGARGVQGPVVDRRVLRDSAARLEAIVATAVDGILSIDEAGVIDTVNAAAERLFGYTAAELLGQNVSVLMPSPTRQEHGSYLRSYLDTGRKRVIGIGREVVGRRKDGSAIDLDLSVNEMQVDGQRMFTGILRDITERKRAEHALEERAVALARSNAELQQFAYVASHDLQEPLRKVASYVEILAADYGEHLDDQAREYIGFAVDGAHRMSRLIGDLLAVSRVRVDAMTVSNCDIGALVGEILDDYALAIQEAHATVQVTGLPVIPGDQAHLRQAFQNLISNAIKYRREIPLTLSIGAVRDGETWLFTVSDNGIGFEQKYAEQVFRMFQRLVSRGQYEGTGIGLAIVAKVVDNHGGRIWAQSQPGVGTTFFFSLPAFAPMT